MNEYQNNKGFTLIELLVTVAILGIIMGIGVPSFNSTIRSNRLSTNSNALVIALTFARGESIKRNSSVTIKAKNGNTSWDTGWDVFVDTNGNGSQDSGDELIKTYSGIPQNFTLRADKSFLTFTSQGLVKTENTTTFNLCAENKDASAAKKIVVNAIGRPTIKTGVSTCP